jgi:hypothetical protein
MTARSRQSLVLVALLVLTAFGGWLRLRSASFGLPARQNYDEKYMFDELDMLRSGRPDVRADPAFGIYPLLLPRLVRLFDSQAAKPPPRTFAEELERASRDLHLLRSFAALLALLCVPCTWFLARRFLDTRGALLATALMATSLLHVWYAGQARPHSPASGAIALALVGALSIRRHGTGWAYALAALGTLLAIGSSQIGVGVLPSLVLAHLLRPRSGSQLAHAWFGAALLAIAWGAWILCPGWFQRGASLAPIETGASAFVGKGFARIALGLWHFEPWLAALALAGVCAWSARRCAAFFRPKPAEAAPVPPFEGPRLLRWLRGREDLAILCAWALPYLGSILLFDRSAQRYFLPLMPCTAALAAWSLGEAAACAAPRWRTLAGLAPGLLLFTLQAALALRATAVLTAPDTSAAAAHWIESELDPAQARIALLPGLDLPLAREPESLQRGYYLEQKPSSWARYQQNRGQGAPGSTAWKLFTLPLHGAAAWTRAREDPLGFLEEAGTDYIVVELAGRAMLGEVVESLRSCTTLVARFSPMRQDEGDDTPFLWWDHQNEYREGRWWIWRLLQARSMGSVLEIRRVPRPPAAR